MSRHFVKLPTVTSRLARAICLLLVAACALYANPATAIEYRVEVVVFEHVNGDTAGTRGTWYPSPRRAISLGTDNALVAGFFEFPGERDLAEEAQRMAASGRYRVLHHYAWQQPGLDDSEAVRVRVALGPRVPLWISEDANRRENFIPASLSPQPGRSEQVGSLRVNGTLRVRLGRFLHLESRLVYTDPDSGRSYRLHESRKMRSRELHYIDNPKFGILTRILPVETPDASGAAPVDPTVNAVDEDDSADSEGTAN